MTAKPTADDVRTVRMRTRGKGTIGVTFLERTLHMQFGDRGLTQIMNGLQLGHGRVGETRDRIAPLDDRPRRTLSAVTDVTRAAAPDLYRRYLTLFLDGIRTDSGPPTPCPRKPCPRAKCTPS